MALYEIDDFWGYQDANENKTFWQSTTAPVDFTTGEVYLDTSLGENNKELKRKTATGWEVLNKQIRAYNGVVQIDQNNDAILIFKTPENLNEALIKLAGFNFPSYFYTELGQHLHAAGTLAGASTTHTHTMNSHNHGVGTLVNAAESDHTHGGGSLYTGSTGLHDHGGSVSFAYAQTGCDQHSHVVTTDGGHSHTTIAGTTAADGGHNHNISGSTAGTVATMGGPSGTTITGSTANTGVNGGTISTAQKTVFTGSLLRVYYSPDGSAWTQDTTNDYSGLFSAGGTAEIDITSKVTENSINFVKFNLNTASQVGGTIAYHIETW